MSNSNELQHWGIKGMRWGVRRYQNKDGSLTPAGKKRYDDDDYETDDLDQDRELIRIEERKKRVLNAHSATELYKNKDLFSDKELLEAYLRLNTERNIRNLIPEKVSKGQKFINSYTKTSKTIKSIVDASDDIYKSYEKGMKLLSQLNKPKP